MDAVSQPPSLKTIRKSLSNFLSLPPHSPPPSIQPISGALVFKSLVIFQLVSTTSTFIPPFSLKAAAASSTTTSLPLELMVIPVACESRGEWSLVTERDVSFLTDAITPSECRPWDRIAVASLLHIWVTQFDLHLGTWPAFKPYILYLYRSNPKILGGGS